MDYYQAINVKQLKKWNWWCVGQYYGIIVPGVVVNTIAHLNSTEP